jgi:transcriptional regulator with XRE-family HTH domain
VVASCGLKQPTLEHILSGKSLPNAASLACLCRGLDVSADWILFGEARG